MPHYNSARPLRLYDCACVICWVLYLLLYSPPLQKLSFTRARELRVCTARLPVDEYMVKKDNAKNFHSKILAVNQGEPLIITCKTAEDDCDSDRARLCLQCLISC